MAFLYGFLAFMALNIVMAQRGKGPQMARNFYDQILNNPGSERFGQNLTFLKETLHDDWNVRPNPLGEKLGNLKKPLKKFVVFSPFNLFDNLYDILFIWECLCHSIILRYL